MSNREKIIEEISGLWEEKIKEILSGRDPALVFLELAVKDLELASQNIDCPYCSRHITLEAEELSRVIKAIESEGNKEKHRHGLRERLSLLISAFKITYYIILGGLFRAGILKHKREVSRHE